MALVADHMTREPVAVSPLTQLATAARRMAEHGVGALLVLDGGRLAGILTERDILMAVGEGFDPESPVADRMTRHPETIEPTDTTDHAAVLMLHGGFRHLPVVEKGNVVGILSIRDLMRVALEDRMPRGA